MRQVISWRYEDGKYYAYNYLYGTTDENSPYDLTDGSSVSTSLIKLAGAIEYQLNTRKTNTGYDYGYTPIAAYFKQAVDNGLASINILKTSSDWETDTSEGATSYLDIVSDFTKIEVDDSNASGSISGNNIIIGPIKLTFSGTIKSISVDGYTGTIYWAKSSSSDNWSSTASNITSNKEIYIKLNKNKITDSETYNITFVQNTGIYNCELIITASDTNTAQQFGTYAVGSSPYTEKATAEVPASYYINININKKDADTGDAIEGIGFTIYDSTEGKYIITSSGSSSAGYTSGTGKYTSSTSTSKVIVYTDEDGKINISDLLVSSGKHKIVVTEVKSNNEYYTTVDVSQSNTVTEADTIEYTFENEPLELVISKTVSDTNEKLQGVGFKIKYSDGTWVKGNGSGNVSYVSSSSKASEYVTGKSGTVSIVGLKKGTYTIYETSIDGTYATGVYLEDQDGYDETNKWVKCGTIKVNTKGKTTYSVSYENTKSGNLSIEKYDDTTGEKLSNVYFKLYYVDEGTWVSGDENENKVYVSSADSATAYGTVDGVANINYLRLGTYKIYEVANDNVGYYLEEQTEEHGLDGYSYDSTTGMVYIGEIDITVNNTVEISKPNIKSGNLSLEKYDDTTGEKLNNVYFKLYFVDEGTWVSGDENENKVYVSSADSATAYGTVDGVANINYLKLGTYKIYEVANDNIGYYLEDQTEANGLKGYSYDSTTGMVYIGEIDITANSTLEISKPNLKSGNLSLEKYDDQTGETLSNVYFKLYFVDEGTWVSGDENENKVYVSSADSATAYGTVNGVANINYLRLGTYKIYEVANDNDGYYLEDQTEDNGLEGYIYDSTTGMVYIGEIDISANSTLEIQKPNVRRLKLSGYVWVDDVNKEDVYNNLWDSGELRVEGVTVNLYNKNGKKAATTTTDSNGEYNFGYECYLDSYTGVKMTRASVGEFYVEFDYSTIEIDGSSGTEYIPVSFNSEDADSIVDNGSRALMDEVEEYDTDLDGNATTYKGTKNETLYGLSGNLYNKLYDSDSNTLEWINLGLIPIYDPNYEINENLIYVKIVVNDYEYMYEYSELRSNLVGDDDTVTTPTVSFQSPTSITTYSRYMNPSYERCLYPSDLALALLSQGEKVQVYVVYGIAIQNETSYSVENRYVEQQLHITSLTNKFDSTRYELDNSSNIGDGEAMNDTEDLVNDYFSLWSTSEAGDEADTQVTTFDINGYNKLVNGTTGSTIDLDPYTASDEDTSDTATVYIQFKVTLEGIAEILENPDGVQEDYPTTAITDGYHTYTRKDYSWENDITATQTHITKNEEENSSAPYLVFKLPEDDDYEEEENEYLNREISGIVFEDTDSSDDEEAVGNGQYDDGENLVANVTVELLDSDGNAVYQYAVYNQEDEKYYLYDGENYWTYDSDGNITKVTDIDLTSDDALLTTVSDENGEYSLSGMIPNEYYLKFTYYDENNTNLQTTINGETISINDYKSTIVTSTNVANAIKGNDSTEGEWYKYCDDDGNTNYSVAVDDLDQREDYNDEYYEALYDEEKEITITQMEATTATFAITVENTTDTSHAGYTTIYYKDSNGNITETEPDDLTGYTIYTDSFFAYEYTGFNFGIIIQPEQSLEIEKLITNVKLVNTPTTIFDGNPEEDELDGVSDLDGSTNGGSTYTRVEVEEDIMYGSELTITYEVTITNTSDVNYYETDDEHYGWYYMFGEHGDYSQIVYISVDTLYDYLDYDLLLEGSIYESVYSSTDTSNDNIIDVTNSEFTYVEGDATEVYSEQQREEIDTILYTIENLSAVAREEETGGSVAVANVITINASKVLSTSDDSLAYSNIADIIEAKNTDSSGNEDTGSIKLVTTPVLPDSAEAYITVSPPTGGNGNEILIYVIAGLGVLMILSIGIVFIKKKVL